MLEKCMFMSCEFEAITQCFTDGESPLKVCFSHERELVDRYGYPVVMPRPLTSWDGTLMEAVTMLRNPYYA